MHTSVRPTSFDLGYDQNDVGCWVRLLLQLWRLFSVLWNVLWNWLHFKPNYICIRIKCCAQTTHFLSLFFIIICSPIWYIVKCVCVYSIKSQCDNAVLALIYQPELWELHKIGIYWIFHKAKTNGWQLASFGLKRILFRVWYDCVKSILWITNTWPKYIKCLKSILCRLTVFIMFFFAIESARVQYWGEKSVEQRQQEWKTADWVSKQPY